MKRGGGIFRHACLPVFQPFDWVNEHQNIYQKTVPNRQDQNDFDCSEKGERTPKFQLKGENKSNRAKDYVADGVGNRIAEIIERSGIFAVMFDDGIGVFGDFPDAFDENCEKKKPRERGFSIQDFVNEQIQNPEKKKAVKQMRERIRIEKMLGSVLAPSVERGEIRGRVPFAPPNSALIPQPENCQNYYGAS